MKKLTCLAIALTLVFSMFIGIPATQAAAIYNFYDDFSNGGDAGKVTHIGESLSPFNVFENAGGTKGVADIRDDPDDETNKVMYLKNTGNIADLANHTNIDIQFSPTSRPAFPNKTVLEFKFKIPNVYTGNKYEFRFPEVSWHTLLAIEDGKIKVANRDQEYGSYVAGKWYTFKLAIISNRATFYIDNAYVRTITNFPSRTSPFQSRIKMQSATDDPAKPAEIYVDDIKVYAIDATRIISNTQVDVGNTFEVKFNNDIATGEFTASKVKVYKGADAFGEEITGLIFTKQPTALDTYTITFPSDLVAWQSYTIALNGVADVVENSLNLTHTFIPVGEAPEGLAIISVPGFFVNNTENTVTSLLGFKVSDFVSKIVTDSLDNKISIIDAGGQAVDANAYLKKGMKIKLENADETEDRIYSLVFNYYLDTNFNGYTDTVTNADKTKLPTGLSFGTWQGSMASNQMYVQGVADGAGGNMLKYYLSNGDRKYSQMPLNVSSVTTTTDKKIMVTEATIKMEDNNDKFAIYCVGQRTGGTYYLPVVEFNQSRKIKSIGTDIMEYEINKWYKVVSVYNFSTDTGKIYVNGVLAGEELKSGFFPANQAYINLQSIRIQKQAEDAETSESVSYIDDYKCYEIGNYAGFDVQGMMSEVDYTVTSNVLNVKSNSFVGEINGYKGMTAQQLKDSLIKSPGASVELYDTSGIVTENVAKDNYILVTAPNGRLTKKYNLNSETNLGDIQFFFGGEPSDKVYGIGEVTARVDVVLFDKPVNTALIIAQYKKEKLVGVNITEKTVGKIGDYIDCSYTVEDAENTTIKCMLWDGMTTMKPLKGELVAAPFVETDI